MPLTWKRGGNPYYKNAFSTLRLGPFVSRGQIATQARELTKIIKTGGADNQDENSIDEHSVGEASKKLLDKKSFAEELLFVHPQVPNDKRRQKKLVKELKALAKTGTEDISLTLLHPLALFWFTPFPDPAIISVPEWEELGLSVAGDSEDLLSDIVFDE